MCARAVKDDVKGDTKGVVGGDAGKAELPILYNLSRRDVTVPGWEDCWVQFRDDITVGEIEVLDRAREFSVMQEILANYIHDWRMWDTRDLPNLLPNPYKDPDILARIPIKVLLWCTVAITEVSLRGSSPLPKEGGRSAS